MACLQPPLASARHPLNPCNPAPARRVSPGVTIRVLLLLALGGPLPTAAEVPIQSEAYSAFYNLDYDRALALFERETTQNPQDPEAWNHLAHGLLHRRLFLAGGMSSELVSSNESLLKRPKLDMPPDEEKRFIEAVERSMDLCRRRLKVRKDDPVALYALGVAHAHRAKYHLLVRKAHFDALRDGNRSRGHHNRLRQVDPAHPDALLIPGMHEYIASKLSPFVRFMAAMAGFSGNRERAIRLLEESVRRGRKTGVEARLLLALTFHREKLPHRALPLMRDLSTAFPRNYLYRGEVVLLQAHAGERDAAVQNFARLQADTENPVPAPHLLRIKQHLDRLAGEEALR
ncbi:MAG TPA: tetratricopeptide repeat protein [Bryobacteraceae bacterium]|nr:tetratricopeptide repeat protein [Bryobacteraceae bacterium]